MLLAMPPVHQIRDGITTEDLPQTPEEAWLQRRQCLLG